MYLYKKKIMKGCVYFFKHVGISPIKVGYTSNDSPIDRFNHFTTYAPYGGEIVGFFMCDNPLLIEQKIHKKYASKRLKGEWFDITKEDVEREIMIYRSDEEVGLRNKFEIYFAEKLGYSIQSGIPKNDIQLALDELFLKPVNNVGEFMTATEIQCAIIDNTEYNCTSLKMLGIELKNMFGTPKFKDRNYRYFVFKKY
jgi:hypothetical protein